MVSNIWVCCERGVLGSHRTCGFPPLRHRPVANQVPHPFLRFVHPTTNLLHRYIQHRGSAIRTHTQTFVLPHGMRGKKRVMVPTNEVYLAAVKYEPEPIQDLEPGVVGLEEDGKPEDRVELALQCLPHYDASTCWTGDSTPSFRYWKTRDYAYAYQSRLATPSMVAERFISAMEEFSNKKPPTPLLISFDAEEVRKQAAASTQRFKEGHPLSILDGIFMAIKDDIDCYPYPSKGATTWFHEVRLVKKDAVSVSRLRSCGVIFVVLFLLER